MGRALRLIERFWFTEAPASRLALLRILIGGYALNYLLDGFQGYVRVAQSSPGLFEPAGPVAFLNAPLSAAAFRLVLLVTVAANVAFVLGLSYRLSGPLFAGLLLWVLSYRNSWGMIYHYDNLLVLQVLVLGLTPAADAWSLDAILRSLVARNGPVRGLLRVRNPTGDWAYGSAIRLICAVTVSAYALAGVAKVASPYGWSWGSGEVLRTQVAHDALWKELLRSGGASDLVFVLYEHLWLFTMLGIGTLVVELGAPLVLFSRRLAYAWAAAALLMHWGIFLIMEIDFPYQLSGLAFLPFLDLDRLVLWAQRGVGPTLARTRGRLAGVGLARAAPAGLAARRRPLLLAAALLALAAGSVGLSRFTASRVAVSAASSSPATDCPAPCDLYYVAWVGDILLGDAAQPQLDRSGYTWPFQQVRPLLAADFVVGNAEGPITERTEKYFPDEQWAYNARPQAAAALAEVGFGALGLSNNHALDRGPAGLADTLRHLRGAGIQPFGAGMNEAEAAAPLLITTPHGTIAALGFSPAWTHGAVAGPDQAGTIPYSSENIVRQLNRAKSAGARWVVAYVHWGSNYEPVRPEQRRVAAAFAWAGYDLVVGHHPHVAQEVDLIDRMPVLYSLGNFTFGSPGRFSPRMPGYGLVARTGFGQDGLAAIELRCILTDNDVVKYQPRPCDESQSRALIEGLGPHVAWQDGKGVVRR